MKKTPRHGLAAVFAIGLLLNAGWALSHEPGAEGTALPGHLQDSGGHPAITGSGTCVDLGYSIGPNHPEGCAAKVAPRIEPPKPVTLPEPKPEPRPAPPVVMAPPVPAPVPAPKPAPRVEKIALGADAAFDTGKADLKAEGRAKLDELASKLAGVQVDSIVVTGHTDSMGAAATNRKLSERRAQTVKAYLAGKGVDDSKIQAVGKGEDSPVATNKTRDGRARNRRVEVEINGMRTISD